MSDDIERLANDYQVRIRNEVDAIVITDQASYNAANAVAARAAEAMKRIDAVCDPVIESAHKAHKVALEQKKKLRAGLEDLKRAVEQKMVTWYRAEQARVAEERRRAEEEARRIAEEKALADAQALADLGMSEAADAALETPVVIARQVVAEPEKAGGESYREIWSAEVVDLMSLVKAVAAGRAPIAYLTANTTALGQAARAFHGTVDVPGVRFYATTSIARRTA